ncbi:MAG: TlpA family protein disulfide reductase [Candidatus Aminicenantes bacterium]|jgi:peroxiredoxin|nr:MAG: TlpA family protein disulfide reductase [Candidatus Aminicenantes bacterium]
MKRFILVLLPLVIVLFVCAKAEKASILGNNSSQAPDFTVKDLRGREISLSNYSGKVVFLNFWATWCGPCKAEIPDFIEAYKQNKDKGMEIIGISVDRISPKSVLKFAEKYKINYPVVMSTDKIQKDYEPGPYIPTTIIIDQEGKIRHRHIGYMSKEAFEGYFLKLTEEK